MERKLQDVPRYLDDGSEKQGLPTLGWERLRGLRGKGVGRKPVSGSPIFNPTWSSSLTLSDAPHYTSIFAILCT